MLCLVANAPFDLTAKRLNTGLAHVELSWSSPLLQVTGYEVFSQLMHDSYNIPHSIKNTTATAVNITSGLYFREMYKFYVISYISNGSASLPSVTNFTEMEFGE